MPYHTGVCHAKQEYSLSYRNMPGFTTEYIPVIFYTSRIQNLQNQPKIIDKKIITHEK